MAWRVVTLVQSFSPITMLLKTFTRAQFIFLPKRTSLPFPLRLSHTDQQPTTTNTPTPNVDTSTPSPTPPQPILEIPPTPTPPTLKKPPTKVVKKIPVSFLEHEIEESFVKGSGPGGQKNQQMQAQCSNKAFADRNQG